MRKLVVIVAFMVFFPVVLVFAQSQNTIVIPEGMEMIKIGGRDTKIIVPKGAKTRRVGAQIITEGTTEYAARRFHEMENRFATIEKKQEEIREKVEELIQMINEIRQNISKKSDSDES